MDDCIFCQIVANQIPSTRIYEDDLALSFLDIGPISSGHTLVIPKKHYAFMDQCDTESISAVIQACKKIAPAIVKVTQCDGYNILCNNGRASGQIVDHVHFHIIPRMTGDGVFSKWPAGKYPEGKMQELAELIKQTLQC